VLELLASGPVMLVFNFDERLGIAVVNFDRLPLQCTPPTNLIAMGGPFRREISIRAARLRDWC